MCLATHLNLLTGIKKGKEVKTFLMWLLRASTILGVMSFIWLAMALGTWKWSLEKKKSEIERWPTSKIFGDIFGEYVQSQSLKTENFCTSRQFCSYVRIFVQRSRTQLSHHRNSRLIAVMMVLWLACNDRRQRIANTFRDRCSRTCVRSFDSFVCAFWSGRR